MANIIRRVYQVRKYDEEEEDYQSDFNVDQNIWENQSKSVTKDLSQYQTRDNEKLRENEDLKTVTDMIKQRIDNNRGRMPLSWL